MRDGMRRSAGLALLLGILCAPPAQSQDRPQAQRQDQPSQPLSTPDRSGPAPRPWSDPPTKPQGAADPATTRSAATPETAGTKRPTSAAVRSPVRVVEKPVRVAPRVRTVERRNAARHEAETRRAARPGRRTMVEAPPARAVLRAPPVRVARPLPPEMRGSDVDLWIDARADRIRRARDGGYLVMRRSTIEDPMGRRMQILRPLDDDEE